MENNISKEELERSNTIIREISNYYSTRIVGQRNLQVSLIISLIANGHILVESVPGLAKTTAAKVLTESCNGRFSRIQCTPDLLPSDIVGTQTYNARTGKFETKIGPVYANFILLDEINRSSSKTQSAMLEAMQERQVSIGGDNIKLPDVFIVIATQNPIEQEGTYLLSEAQQDRFLIKEVLNYPNQNEELEVINRIENNVFNQRKSVVSLDDIIFLQNLSKRVYIIDRLKKLLNLSADNQHNNENNEEEKPNNSKNQELNEEKLEKIKEQAIKEQKELDEIFTKKDYSIKIYSKTW